MKNIFRSFLDFLFPPRCCFCRSFLKRGETGVCRACHDSLPRSGEETVTRGETFSVCLAPLAYEGDVKKAFQRFKFSGAVNYAAPFGKLMAEALRKYPLDDYELITWVPVSARRRKRRGYDQSMLIAYAVALELDDVAVETLVKVKDTPAQSGLSGTHARRENVSGAFTVRDPELVAGKHVLLIDDVLTTGATFSECAGMLRHAGAARVSGLVLAKTPSSGAGKRTGEKVSSNVKN